MQFTLKELFSLKFLLLHRKKIDFENFQKGLLIILYNLLVFYFNFFLFINLIKGFQKQFSHSKTFTLIFCNFFDSFSYVYPKKFLYYLFLVIRHLLSYISPWKWSIIIPFFKHTLGLAYANIPLRISRTFTIFFNIKLKSQAFIR